MKWTVAFLSIASISAFAPSARFANRLPSVRALGLGLDPFQFQDFPHHFEAIQASFSTFSLADAADVIADTPFPSSDAVVEAAADSGNGWFGFLTGPIEGLLYLIHSGFQAAGLQANTWGISIVLLTVLIKVATFPLTKTQLESTNKMQVRRFHPCSCHVDTNTSCHVTRLFQSQ